MSYAIATGIEMTAEDGADVVDAEEVVPGWAPAADSLFG
jgi:hypothetical protein